MCAGWFKHAFMFMEVTAMSGKTKCNSCVNYIYDMECNYYECQVNLDEDEMGKFLSRSFDDCPYFQFYDEYKTVRKQN